MKIKTVCEQTGLTDRAVRYYIEEEILHPSFTENYLGRKTYDFSDEDVQMLKDIAVLRKFGFSVAQIKEMQTCPEKTYSITQDLKNEKKEIINTQQELLASLEQLNSNESYTLDKLAFVLQNPTKDKALPKEDNRFRILKTTVRIIAKTAVAIIACIPIIIVLIGFIDSLVLFRHPKIEIKALLLTLVCLLPSVACLILLKIKKKNIRAKAISFVSLLTCLVLILILFPATLVMCHGVCDRSETTDFADYRKFDKKCDITNADIFLEILPEKPPFDIHSQSDLSAHEAEYCYRFIWYMDPCSDTIVSWKLQQADFKAEINRVKSLFKKYEQELTENGYTISETTFGDFACIMYHSGAEPFSQSSGIFTHCIFAYNEKTNAVRYIYSYSRDSTIPKYVSLEWW